MSKEIVNKRQIETSQLDRLEQRIIDLAHQQTLLLSLDNKEIFKLLEKAEAENKTLTEQVRVLREALEKIAKSGQDPLGRKWARDALTTIKGEPI